MLLTKLAKANKYTARFFMNLKELEQKGHKESDKYLVKVTENKIILTKIEED